MNTRDIHKRLEEIEASILSTAEAINNALEERNYQNKEEFETLYEFSDLCQDLIDVFYQSNV